MRKILAGFMATSMIVAMASATTFAAAPTFVIQMGDITYNQAPTASNVGNLADTDAVIAGNNEKDKKVTEKYSATLELGTIEYEVTYGGSIIKSGKITNSLNAAVKGDIDLINGGGTSKAKAEVRPKAPDAAATISAADIAKLVAGAIGQVTVETTTGTDGQKGNVYVLKASASGDNVVFTSTTTAMPAGVKLTVECPNAKITNETFDRDIIVVDTVVGESTNSGTRVELTMPAPSYVSTFSYTSTAAGKDYADVETSGTLKDYPVDSVVVCDGEGNPVVFTENKNGVDEDQNNEGGVQSAKTIYFLLRDDGPIPKLDDDTFWKLKVTKGDNGKYIKNISDVSKNFKNGLFALNSTVQDSRTVNRHRYIKVELNDIYTDDEYKMTLDLRISPKSKAVNAELLIGGNKVTDDTELKVKDFYFYMKNLVKDADNDWKVGIDGLMLNPLENDWNDVTWYDEDGDVAHMKFFADSDVGKFYSKLSTKWEHADYASYFNDQDAFIFNFTGSPKLSSTSRADLEIYNPFIDEDGNATIDPATAVVYQVIDGDLYDVTDSFEYKEGENGDMAFVTRTRFLGTYIICEKAVEEAVADETVPDELTPDTTEAPEDVTPDNNAGGKQPANTGKYL